MTQAETKDIKRDAHWLVDNLPDGATWDDVMERVYVRQAVEADLRDVAEGCVVEVSEVRRRFGLVP
jgi:hypothetical protein